MNTNTTTTETSNISDNIISGIKKHDFMLYDFEIPDYDHGYNNRQCSRMISNNGNKIYISTDYPSGPAYKNSGHKLTQVNLSAGNKVITIIYSYDLPIRFMILAEDGTMIDNTRAGISSGTTNRHLNLQQPDKDLRDPDFILHLNQAFNTFLNS